MGVDIKGWVEVSFAEGHWSGVIHIPALVERNYGVFGSLFDVKNADEFSTPFARRGLPPDISLTTDQESQDQSVVAPTWISEEELKTVNWDELGDAEAGIQYVDWDKLSADPEFEYAPLMPDQEDPGRLILRRKLRNDGGGTWETFYRATPGYRGPHGAWIGSGHAGAVYQEVHRTRREVLSLNWQVLFHLMGVLGESYGDARVRLVAWFDSE